MPKRERVSKSKSQTKREAEPAAQAVDTKEGLKDELDALLDEVDSVLETNAAEFVAAYVQKGGE
jgi:ubiquitin-like protein Pup